MKKKTENKLGLLTAEDLKKEIEITHKEVASSLLYQIIDKCGAKKTLALAGRAYGLCGNRWNENCRSEISDFFI